MIFGPSPKAILNFEKKFLSTNPVYFPLYNSFPLTAEWVSSEMSFDVCTPPLLQHKGAKACISLLVPPLRALTSKLNVLSQINDSVKNLLKVVKCLGIS